MSGPGLTCSALCSCFPQLRFTVSFTLTAILVFSLNRCLVVYCIFRLPFVVWPGTTAGNQPRWLKLLYLLFLLQSMGTVHGIINYLISYYVMLYFTCVNYNSLRPIQIFPGPAISDVLYPPLFQTDKHDERHLSCVFARLTMPQPGVM